MPSYVILIKNILLVMTEEFQNQNDI